MKYLLLCSLILSLSVSSCTNKDNSKQKLQDEVIAIHDEVMPMMGAFVRNSMLIDSLLVSFEKIKIENPTIDTIQEKEKLVGLKAKIENANNSMNSWMHDLNLDFDQMSNEDVEKYLTEEKTKIQQINKEFKAIETESKQSLNIYKK